MLNPAQDGLCPEKVESVTAQTALHNPSAGITPEQRRAAIAHRRLRARIAARACEDIPIKLRHGIAVATPEPPKPEPVFSMGQWVERQKEIHKPYETWFSIEEDVTPPPRFIRIEDIQRACAKHYNVSRHEILSERRTANIVRPRQVAFYLCKQITLRSLPEIGRKFGGRDHTTALHSINKIKSLLKADAFELAADITAIKATLGIVGEPS